MPCDSTKFDITHHVLIPPPRVACGSCPSVVCSLLTKTMPNPLRVWVQHAPLRRVLACLVATMNSV